MGQIHVVTDSGSDLPVKLREELGIQVVPLTVRFGDEVFKDGVDPTVAGVLRPAETGDPHAQYQPAFPRGVRGSV